MVPSAPEVERAVLGAVLVDGGVMPQAVDLLREDHFYEQRNRVTWQAMLDLHDDAGQVDELTLCDFLRRNGHLETVGGLAYVCGLSNELPDVSGFAAYVDILEERRIRRALMEQASEIMRLAQSGDDDARSILASQQRVMDSLGLERESEGLVPMGERLESLREDLYHPPDESSIISTGFPDLDRVVQGWAPGQLIYVAGRPGMGKSVLGLQFGLNAAKAGKVAGLFSLEMSRDEIGKRVLSMESGVQHDRIRRGHLHPQEVQRVEEAAERLTESRLLIDDAGGNTVARMAARVEQRQRWQPVDLVIVDYVQLIDPGVREGNENERITEISRSLKVMAKRLGVPVIALSQLSRNVESRADKRPLLSDLRSSGSLEQDGDAVIFIYREGYYDHNADSVAEVTVAKQRAGRTGTVRMYFDGPHLRFSPLAQEVAA